MSNMLNEYVKRPTNVKSDLAEVMDRRQNDKIKELDNIKLDAMIAEEKKKLQDLSPAKIDLSQATNFMSTIFAGKTPLEIKEMIRSFTQEDIDKITYMAKGMNQNSFDPRGLPPRESNNEVKNMLEALKIGLEAGRKNDNSGISTKDLLDALKTGAELSKAQQPPVQQQQDPMAVYKMVQEIIHPFQEAANNQGRQLQEIKMKELESRIVDPIAYVKNMKSVAADLGLTSTGAANEFTLKKAEMDQTERLETKKLEWEMKKWELDKEKEGSTLETVKEILAGPAGEILKNFGSAGADRLRGNKAPNPNGQSQQSQLVKVKCPNCTGDFSANPQLATIQCPLCGVQLQNGNQAAHEQAEHSNQPAPSAPSQEMPKDQPPPDSAQVQPLAKEKPVDQTLEVESPVEQITTKQ